MTNKEGTREQWYWIETNSNDFDIDAFLKHHSEFIVGSYVAINSFDSGTLTWGKDELAMDNDYINGTPVTCRVIDVMDIPTAGFDEWYLFVQTKEFDLKESFINYIGFSLHADKSKMVEKFWKQMNNVISDKFLAQNRHFLFVTKDSSELESVKKTLANMG